MRTKGFRQVFKHYFAFPASVEMPWTLDFVLLASAGNGAGVLLKKMLTDHLSPAVYQRCFFPPCFLFGFENKSQQVRLRALEGPHALQLPLRWEEPSTHGVPATCLEHQYLLLHSYPIAFWFFFLIVAWHVALVVLRRGACGRPRRLWYLPWV